MAGSKPPNPMRYLGLGLELAGAVGMMALIGYGIDQWRGTSPWWLVSLSMVGIVGGLYNVLKDAIRSNRRE